MTLENGFQRAAAAKASPLIGIVIPVHGHSGLVVEAVQSLAAQKDPPAFALVLVNDGCPLAETDLVGVTLADWGLPFAHYVKRANGGLSAARNTGVDFLLSRYADLKAIYLLDADNSLESYALNNMASALQEHPEAAWFYPDIHMFGLKGMHEYGGDYSGLIHAGMNISEAGSLVRRALFDAGVRFDEAMRQGYEDWEFWLSALEAGFEGRHLPNMGFRYRKRPESMLSDSHRDDEQIRGYIRRKHRKLYRANRLLTLEAKDSPRYAIVTDKHNFLLATDPSRSREIISFDEAHDRFWRSLLRPDRHFFPPFIVYCNEATLSFLQEQGLLLWALWDLENRQRECHVSGVRIERSKDGGIGVDGAEPTTNKRLPPVQMTMITSELARGVTKEASVAWLVNLLSNGRGFNASVRTIHLQSRSSELLPADAESGLLQVVVALCESRFRPALEQGWRSAASGLPDRQQAYLNVREAMDGGTVYPRLSDGRKHVAFLMVHADFGGVEKVAYNVARELKAQGFVPHLVLFREGDIRLPPEFTGVFESLLWVTAKGMMRWTGDPFVGTRLSWWSQQGTKHEVFGLLSGFDVVVNCSSVDAHGIAGDLKRRGVVTVTHQHVVEHSYAGRPGGNAALARAFEHSYDLVLTCSQQLQDWFIANGVPQAKTMVIENAPSYAMDSIQLATLATSRAPIEIGSPSLNLLYLGRLDAQKGLDRLLDIISTTISSPHIAWRVVGKSIVDQDPAAEKLGRIIDIEAPVYSASELTKLYMWADVVVLPSRYEGSPLTILEAMRCGVIVIAAEAGAIDEHLINGVNGFVVSQGNCVGEMRNLISKIHIDIELRRSMSSNAMITAAAMSWAKNVAPLVEVLDNLICKNIRA